MLSARGLVCRPFVFASQALLLYLLAAPEAQRSRYPSLVGPVSLAVLTAAGFGGMVAWVHGQEERVLVRYVIMTQLGTAARPWEAGPAMGQVRSLTWSASVLLAGELPPPLTRLVL